MIARCLSPAAAHARQQAGALLVDVRAAHERALGMAEGALGITREALLDAAEILILEQSIPGMSLRAVCTQAGFSQGASYSNFANREELLLAVMERWLRRRLPATRCRLPGRAGTGLPGRGRRRSPAGFYRGRPARWPSSFESVTHT